MARPASRSPREERGASVESVTPVCSEKVEVLASLLETIRVNPDPDIVALERFQSDYQELTRAERFAFFDCILRRMETRKEDIQKPLDAILEASEPIDAVDWSRKITRLRKQIESPRMKAFRRFLSLSGGLKFLLDLRADVLIAQRQRQADLGPLDEEIAHLFDSWFQQGFLFLQEITQDSPYRQIRFLKDHDLVHPMTNLEEMGRRLGGDRRCFALYHRAMPEEPVVFIEAALTRRLARSIHEILRESDGSKAARSPDTAIFYSINSTQNGLAGLGLGKLLIFQVVDAIKKDVPSIKTFATLSPIPGLWKRYVKPILAGHDASFALKHEELLKLFPDGTRRSVMKRYQKSHHPGIERFAAVLLEVLSSPAWIEDPVYRKELRKPLVDLTYFYLTKEKNLHGKPLNPVANFHMSNGATVSPGNVNFGANLSERGMRDSCGMMVNYVYSSTWLHQLRRSVRSALPWKS